MRMMVIKERDDRGAEHSDRNAGGDGDCVMLASCGDCQASVTSALASTAVCCPVVGVRRVSPAQ